MNKLKKNKGITLIALVITIIIMVMLAGISISILGGQDGLIEKAKSGANDYKASSDLEKLILEYQDWSLTNNKTFLQYMEEKGYTVEADDETGKTGTLLLNGNIYSVDLNSNNAIELQGPASTETLLKPRINVTELEKNRIKILVKSTGAVSYEYQISTDGTTFNVDGTANNVECEFTGLTASTKYYIKVIVRNEEGVTSEAIKDITTKTPVLVQSITLDKTSELIGLQEATITATVGPNDADNKAVTWSSSDTGKVSIESSTDNSVTIKGLADTGSSPVTITATAADGSNVSATCQIEVFNGELIYTVEQLETIDDNSTNLAKSYKLMADLDLSDKIYTKSIINDTFKGVFDGNGYTIEGINISSTENTIGFFKYISGATIKNLKVKNAEITGQKGVGIICAEASGSSTISNVSIESSSVTGMWNVGGLCSYPSNVNVNNIACQADITCTVNNDYAGGLFGKVGTATITNCYFYGKIIGGYTDGDCGTIHAKKSWNPTMTNCYYELTEERTNLTKQGTQFAEAFGSMTSLPSGFSSDVWQIVNGYPELKVFIK